LRLDQHAVELVRSERLTPDPADVFPALTWLELEQALDTERKHVARHTKLYPGHGILTLW
jgi:hypothetical protein